MAEVRVTDDIAKKMGLSKINVFGGINAGTIKGRKLSDRIYLIDDSLVPVEKAQDFAVATKTIEPVVEFPHDEDIATVDHLIAFTEKQRLLVEKYTKLQELRGTRDLPEKLKAKESNLNEREKLCREMEETLTHKEDELSKRELNLNNLKLQTGQECAKQLLETQATCRKLKSDTDELLTESRLEIERIDKQIEDNKLLLIKQEARLKEYPELIAPYIEQVNKLIQITEKVAAKYYYKSEQTKGVQSDNYTKRANYSWSLGDGLRKFLTWLNG